MSTKNHEAGLTCIMPIATEAGTRDMLQIDIENDPLAPYALMAYASAIQDVNPSFAETLAAHSMRAVPVQRDEGGEFIHPAFPLELSVGDEEADISEELKEWAEDNGLVCAFVRMSDDDDSDKLEKIFEEEGSYAKWEPAQPPGTGWFVLAILETEDEGPVAIYLRKESEA